MKPLKKILLASHGSPGTRAAERAAIAMAAPGATLFHLVVVPEFWSGMQGDDWLNNASTRDVFGRYVEGLLEKDAAEQVATIEAHCQQQGLDYTPLLRVGDPADCLLAAVRDEAVDLVVIVPPRPKKTSGLRSRMDLEKLVRGLPVPLLVASRG